MLSAIGNFATVIGRGVATGAKVSGTVVVQGVKNCGPHVKNGIITGAIAGVVTSIISEAGKTILRTGPVSRYAEKVKVAVVGRKEEMKEAWTARRLSRAAKKASSVAAKQAAAQG